MILEVPRCLQLLCLVACAWASCNRNSEGGACAVPWTQPRARSLSLLQRPGSLALSAQVTLDEPDANFRDKTPPATPPVNQKSLGVAASSVAAVTQKKQPAEEGVQNATRGTDVAKEVSKTASGSDGSITGVAGVFEDSDGDAVKLQRSMVLSVLSGFGCAILFVVLRGSYPLVYSYNAITETAPPLDGTWTGWVGASWFVTIDQIRDSAGLDAAMSLEFMHLSMKILAAITVPIVMIIMPLHYYNFSDESIDSLGRLGMHKFGKNNEWLCWTHALMCWVVVAICQWYIFEAQRAFVDRRFEWLRQMPQPRCTTLMVRNVPRRWRGDAHIKEYFNHLFGREVVSRAYTVRKTGALKNLYGQYEAKSQQLELALDRHVERRDMANLEKLTREKLALEQEVRQERHRVNEMAAAGDAAIWSPSAFVTFEQRCDAEMVHSLHITANEDEFVVCHPPDPVDVIWEDLQQDSNRLMFRELLGYSCLALLFFGFTPLVLTISSLENLEELRNHVSVLDAVCRWIPKLAYLWSSVLGSLSLTLVVGYVPTVMFYIFKTFYVLRAERWCQCLLQEWYFFFQVIFVLFITCISNSLFMTVKELLHNPLEVFPLLAERLPSATNFYLKYITVQWVVQITQLTRYANLAKYLFYSTVTEPDRARQLSEPEDQDYYGIGARSARNTIILVIALVFSTISPLIAPLALVNFAVSRVVFGYLTVFAETRKPDLGGVFWITSLRHIQQGLIIYVTLIFSILLARSPNRGPPMLAFSCFGFLFFSWRQYKRQFRWEHMPAAIMAGLDSMNPSALSSAVNSIQNTSTASGDSSLQFAMRSTTKKHLHLHESYVQPELLDDEGAAAVRAAKRRVGSTSRTTKERHSLPARL